MTLLCCLSLVCVSKKSSYLCPLFCLVVNFYQLGNQRLAILLCTCFLPIVSILVGLGIVLALKVAASVYEAIFLDFFFFCYFDSSLQKQHKRQK